jgi:hypothetical protein
VAVRDDSIFQRHIKIHSKNIRHQNEHTFTYGITTVCIKNCSVQEIKINGITDLIKIRLRAIFRLSMTSFLNDILQFFCFCTQASRKHLELKVTSYNTSQKQVYKNYTDFSSAGSTM